MTLPVYRLADYASWSLPLSVWKLGSRYETQHVHTHDCMEMMFVCRGTGFCGINDDLYPLLRGDLFVMSPGDRHMFRTDRACEYYNILFREELFSETDRTSLAEFPVFSSWISGRGCCEKFRTVSGASCDASEEILARITGEFRSRKRGFELSAKTLFLEFLLNVLRSGGEKIMPPSPLRYDDGRIPPVLDYLNTHYMENPDVSKLAGIAGVSRSYFSELFRIRTGTTLRDYVLRLKMDKARRMLCSSGLRIGEIALELGFFDSCHFAREFKRASGLTPREYRSREK